MMPAEQTAAAPGQTAPDSGGWASGPCLPVPAGTPSDEAAALAMLRAAFPDGRPEYHHDGWVFYVKGGRWLANPPPDCAPIWGPEPLEAGNPIELARLCSEAETSQAVCDMREEQAAWEAEQREAGRARRERSWAAVFAPGSFMNPTGTRPPTCSPGPAGTRIWHLEHR